MKAVVKVDIEGLNTLERWLNDIVERLPNGFTQWNGLNHRIHRHCLNEAMIHCRRKIAGYDGQKFLRLSFNEAQACAIVNIWTKGGGAKSDLMNDQLNLNFMRKVIGIIHEQIV